MLQELKPKRERLEDVAFPLLPPSGWSENYTGGETATLIQNQFNICVYLPVTVVESISCPDASCKSSSSVSR